MIPNKSIYMYYGFPSTPLDNQYPSAVWDANYKGVWHLKETTGGHGAIKDSTSNNNHGTDMGGPTLGASGKIGNAIGFDGLNDIGHVQNSGSTASLDLTSGPLTISAWFSRQNTNVHIAGKRKGSPTSISLLSATVEGYCLQRMTIRRKA